MTDTTPNTNELDNADELDEIASALTRKEAAKVANVSERTIDNWVRRGMPVIGQPGKWSRVKVRRSALVGVLTGRIVLRALPTKPKVA